MCYSNAASKHISSVQSRFCLILATVAIAIVFMPNIGLGSSQELSTGTGIHFYCLRR